MPEQNVTKVAIDTLNEFLEKSPEACNALLGHRVLVSKEIADHPTIQVQVVSDNKFKVGFIGLLNGIVEQCGGKRIAMIVDNDVIVGFTEYKLKKDPID